MTFNEVQFFKELAQLDRGIEIPIDIFNLCKEYLDIRKGALFLREDSGSPIEGKETSYFAPWVAEGFDETTMRRLRFPSSFIDNHTELFSEASFATDGGVSAFSPFFSFREYAVLNSIVIIPFLRNGRIISFLFIVDSPVLSEMSEHVSSRFFSRASQKIAEILSRMREERLSILNAVDEEPETKNVFDAVDKLIALSSFRNKRMSLIVFDVASFTELISRGKPGADAFRLMRDVLGILRSIVSGMGDAFMLDDRRALVVYGSRSLKTDELLLHRMQETLKYFFRLDEQLPNDVFLIRRYPEDGSSSGSLLAGVM